MSKSLRLVIIMMLIGVLALPLAVLAKPYSVVLYVQNKTSALVDARLEYTSNSGQPVVDFEVFGVGQSALSLPPTTLQLTANLPCGTIQESVNLSKNRVVVLKCDADGEVETLVDNAAKNIKPTNAPTPTLTPEPTFAPCTAPGSGKESFSTAC